MAKNKRKGKTAAPRRPAQRTRPAQPATSPADQATVVDQALADPNIDKAALDQLAAKYMAAKDYDQACRVFKRASQLRPDDPQPLTDMATSLAMTGRLDEARRAMGRAVGLAPDNPKYLANMAKVMIMQGDLTAAREVIDRAMPLADEKRAAELRGLLGLCAQTPAGQAQAVAPSPSPWPPAQVAAPTAPAHADTVQRQPRRPTPLVAASRPLNILFVQEAPCIRNYKTASALRARGHKVCLAYTRATLSQMYKGLSDEVYDRCVRLTNNRHLWDISAKFDLVHCHNEPDVLTVAALAGEAPVIHDTHDLISLRAGGDQNLAFFEGVANRGAHGRVYTTPYQRDAALALYGVKGPSLVFYNYASAGDLPKRFLPKLSAQDGQTHIVYEGGIGGNGHRDFIDLFAQLTQGGLHVHVYPVHFDQAMHQRLSAIPRMHYHQPVSPTEIMEVMSQYDIGIIPFNIVKGNKQFLDSTIANKLFEYLAAGLPVLASPLQSYVDFFKLNNVGKVFHDAAEAIAATPELLRIAASQDLTAHAKTYDGEITRLEDFYIQIIDSFHAGEAAPSQAALETATPPSVTEWLGGAFGFSQ
ncbi:Tetratricopeptide TPR_2 repeat protein [Desulfarculus baarsii DSM 2075]|uniref:Tetratricopeptide TPR_2 repeat protein n=1 Tax=Desulfarculus baarsii (strain ATCC 33931 / DSM 2075 / LMG 7858 / VKM B-1802 / 2st14) TaxID=644282 RepID=E1QFP1_DESB2|nr:tetratricopeptide repeat protein [Desulfarculus baarsii]ADK84377.1 Tetratricopeptide TPR_2 repeat protein [Desulfarculus baarsii DSM 2075]